MISTDSDLNAVAVNELFSLNIFLLNGMENKADNYSSRRQKMSGFQDIINESTIVTVSVSVHVVLYTKVSGYIINICLHGCA